MRKTLFSLLLIGVFAITAMAQTTEFTYQGRLLDSSLPATGSYDFEFKLYDSLVSGTQLGPTETKTGVAVTSGIFTVRLDFGAQFPGAARYLEISVKPSGPGAFTPLAPRQPITSTPYAVKSLNADTATTATNAANLGGVPAANYVITTDPRLTDARDPLPGNANYIQNQNAGPQASSNFNISGTGTADIFSAGTQYNIGANRILSNPGSFNLFAGVGAGASNTSGFANSFFGDSAGFSNTTGGNNAFFGTSAGQNNTIGGNNAFFGGFAGQNNTSGSSNAFFGTSAGESNTSGNSNAFFGRSAGRNNTTGFLNAFFGTSAGQNNTSGNGNAFFGTTAGSSNSIGFSNAFFGTSAGQNNTSGGNNSFIGDSAGLGNTTGANNTIIGAGANVSVGNLSFATAVGAGSVVSSNDTIALGRTSGADKVVLYGLGGAGDTSLCRNAANQISTCSSISVPAGSGNYIQNTTLQQASSNFNISGNGTAGGTLSGNIVNTTTQYNIGGNRILSNPGTNNLFAGVGAGSSNTTGSSNAFFGTFAGFNNTTGSSNAFFGRSAGSSNTFGNNNAFFGDSAGFSNTTGGNNAFFGTFAGQNNTTGFDNAFFGTSAGESNTTGNSNVFFGRSAGQDNTTGSRNTFFGTSAGKSNTTGLFNAFFGGETGFNNTNGGNNAFFGDRAGQNNTTGGGNAFFGDSAGISNATGSFNTIIGTSANVSAGNLTNATAIGADAVVNASNKIRLGNTFVTVIEGQVAYTFSSDKNAKENFLPVDGREVLRKIRGFNMTSWNYKGQDPRFYRHYGPMAQDFYEAFGRDAIGTFGSPTTINSGDMAGITFVAIKELSIENESLKEKAAAQQKQIDELKAQNDQQRAEIEKQRAEIDKQRAELAALKALVCSQNPTAGICKEDK